MKKIFLPVFLTISFLFIVVQSTIYADTPIPAPSDVPSGTLTPSPTPDNTQAEKDVQNRIKELEGKINDLQGTEKTLSSQIAVMDNQITLTELRISSTQSEITDLEKNIKIATNKIGNLENSLDNITKALLSRIVVRYEAGSTAMLPLFTTSSDFTNFFNKENYMRLVQEHDRQLLFNMQQAKNDYANQKQLYESREKKMEALKVQLVAYTDQLDAEQSQKKNLLSQTQGDEANYQKLLAQAKAQLAGFSRFTSSQGGAGLLSGQTVCDGWGCYYNQRDTQWGGLSLNGTQYTIASDGCLVTSMAMVLSHYGHKVTPIDINSNSDNFASYYPAYMLYTTKVDGITAQRIGTSIDSTLNNGNHDPVIVGVNAYGGTHFVVLKSGTGGSYIMNDPYIENGHDISFNAHYSVNSIFEVDKVVIQ
jgi:peptidoglycan hydrolase CwlO-like protein